MLRIWIMTKLLDFRICVIFNNMGNLYPALRSYSIVQIGFWLFQMSVLWKEKYLNSQAVCRSFSGPGIGVSKSALLSVEVMCVEMDVSTIDTDSKNKIGTRLH